MVVTYPGRKALKYNQLLPLVRAELPQEPFVLLGESFGGPLSLQLAAESPPQLQGLILCGSFVSCPFDFIPAWAAHCVPDFPFNAFPSFAKLKTKLGLYANAEHSALSLEALSQVSAEVFACRIREIIRVNTTAELQACNVPILYLQGEHDWVVPRSNLRRIVSLKPQVQTVSIRSSHMILKTEPEASAKAILDFIDKIESRIPFKA